MITGDDSTNMLKAILLHKDFADAGVEDTPEARDHWADIARSVDALPDGVTADIPSEWPDETPGMTASGGGVPPKVPGGDPAAKFNPGELRDDHGRWALSAGELWKSKEGVCEPTPDEAASAERIWYSSMSSGTNDKLRGVPGAPRRGPLFPKDVAAFTDWINRSPAFTQDARMHRGVNDLRMFGPPGTAKGKVFTDKGFVSLTASEEFATGYGWYRLNVVVPKGTHALRADQGVWDSRNGDGYPLDDVQEYTLPPGSRFEVTDDVAGFDADNTDVRTLEVTVLPPETTVAMAAGVLVAAKMAALPGADRFAWMPGQIEFVTKVSAVGPKGYIHGWIFVGAPGVGVRVFHPTHGHGTVHRKHGGKVHVSFDNGVLHSFEYRPGKGKPKFEKRPELPAMKSPPPGPAPGAMAKWFTEHASGPAKAAVATIYGDQTHRWTGETFVKKSDVWNGMMQWDGKMGLDPVIARNAAEILDPNNNDPVRRVQGVKVFLHEIHHSVGSNASPEATKAEAQDYMTKPGHAAEEGYTELGAWLTMPAFLKAMGVDHKMVVAKDGTTKVPIGQLFEQWNDPLTFTGRSSVSANVSYLPQVKSAYEWLDGIQNIEGYNGNQFSHDRIKRITELSIEVNKVSGPAKWDAMVGQWLRAKNITIPDTISGHTARKALADSLAVNWGSGKLTPTDQPAVMIDLANRLDQLRQYGYLENR